MTLTTDTPSPAAFLTSKAPEKPLGIGLIGLGTVGTGVYKLLTAHAGNVANGGKSFSLVQFSVRDTAKNRNLEGLNASQLTTSPMDVVQNPEVDLVIEVAGGLGPVQAAVEEALKRGKSVVTANKELLAKEATSLFALAKASGARLMFEAAVAGGVPVILPLKVSLAANEILQIAGILNGTTNYILTRMAEDGWDFATALKQAQLKGFAEADPTSDVEGYDAAYKIAILAMLAYGEAVDWQQMPIEGISKITPTDIKTAARLGFAVKLIALAKRESTQAAIDLRVHPMLVDLRHPLASVKNEFNAVFIEASAAGETMVYGRGAGEGPTASSVCGDVLALLADWELGNRPQPAMALDLSTQAPLLPVAETVSRYYVRLTTQDLAGVIGELGKACGVHGVSLESVLQSPAELEIAGLEIRGLEPGQAAATIILVTHQVPHRQLQAALETIKAQETTLSVDCVLRVL